MSGNTPSPSTTAANLLRGGLSVTSTATAALNGTYTVQGMLNDAFQAQANALAASGSFADGTTTLNWPDIHNQTHAFDVAQFRSLIAAVANFQSQCTLYALGITTTAPSATATIP